MEPIATALVLAAIVELRVAVHKFAGRLHCIESDHKKIKKWSVSGSHILPPLCVFFCALFVLGCAPKTRAESAPEVKPALTVGAPLVKMGDTMVWTGGLAVVGGTIVKAVSPVGHIGLLIAEAGAIATCSGAVFIWLGNNTWTLAVGLGGLCTAWIWYRWPSLKKWYVARENILTKDSNADPRR